MICIQNCTYFVVSQLIFQIKLLFCALNGIILKHNFIDFTKIPLTLNMHNKLYKQMKFLGPVSSSFTVIVSKDFRITEKIKNCVLQILQFKRIEHFYIFYKMFLYFWTARSMMKYLHLLHNYSQPKEKEGKCIKNIEERMGYY